MPKLRISVVFINLWQYTKKIWEATLILFQALENMQYFKFSIAVEENFLWKHRMCANALVRLKTFLQRHQNTIELTFCEMHGKMNFFYHKLHQFFIHCPSLLRSERAWWVKDKKNPDAFLIPIGIKFIAYVTWTRELFYAIFIPASTSKKKESGK